ncbi:MAG: addiction module protein [Verrucomicrobiales bacterium]|nr:addiction module protein [Verrucomicrobiales bacterium]MCP5557561.1 addiction module protein [Verrucomicrobiaceae bacterium]
MSAIAFDTFLHEALSLPVEQRSRLATVLIDSLETNDDFGLDPAWTDEALRRAEELDNGTVKGLTLEEFREQLEAKIAG